MPIFMIEAVPGRRSCYGSGRMFNGIRGPA
jgi:hypothetical protein